MKTTKLELVKEMFFAATSGKRNLDNFVDGMWLIEIIAANNYAWYIRENYEAYVAGTKSARRVFSDLVDTTSNNVSGVNGPTQRSKEVRRAYYRFI